MEQSIKDIQYEQQIKQAQQIAHKFWDAKDFSDFLQKSAQHKDALVWYVKLIKGDVVDAGKATEHVGFPVALSVHAHTFKVQQPFELVTDIPITRFEYRDLGIAGNHMVVALLKTVGEALVEHLQEPSLKVFTSLKKAEDFIRSPEGKSLLEEKMLKIALGSSKPSHRARL